MDGKWMGDSIIKDRQWSEPHCLECLQLSTPKILENTDQCSLTNLTRDTRGGQVDQYSS